MQILSQHCGSFRLSTAVRRKLIQFQIQTQTQTQIQSVLLTPEWCLPFVGQWAPSNINRHGRPWARTERWHLVEKCNYKFLNAINLPSLPATTKLAKTFIQSYSVFKHWISPQLVTFVNNRLPDLYLLIKGRSYNLVKFKTQSRKFPFWAFQGPPYATFPFSLPQVSQQSLMITTVISIQNREAQDNSCTSLNLLTEHTCVCYAPILVALAAKVSHWVTECLPL